MSFLLWKDGRVKYVTCACNQEHNRAEQGAQCCTPGPSHPGRSGERQVCSLEEEEAGMKVWVWVETTRKVSKIVELVKIPSIKMVASLEKGILYYDCDSREYLWEGLKVLEWVGTSTRRRKAGADRRQASCSNPPGGANWSHPGVSWRHLVAEDVRRWEKFK